MSGIGHHDLVADRPAPADAAGPVDLTALDPPARRASPASKADAPAATEALAPELGDLQERLYASGRVAETPGRRRS